MEEVWLPLPSGPCSDDDCPHDCCKQVFDAISYCKGATVIRMLNAVIGKDAFQKGLQAYFKKHQYGNTEGSDLWAAWGQASGKPIA